MQPVIVRECHTDVTVKIKENSFLARIAAMKLRSNKVAIVFGRTIHLHNTKKGEFLNDNTWVCHELKHVEQYNQYGRFVFLAKYLVEWVQKGYYKNKFEVEARENESNTGLMAKVKFS